MLQTIGYEDELIVIWDRVKIRTVTVGSKIIRALEMIRIKKLVSNAILRNKYFSSHDI